MRKTPSGPALLEIAARTEIDLAARADDPQARYKQAMIKSARAIADRQAAAGDGSERAQLSSLRRLMHDDGGDLLGLTRRLARAIRAGCAPQGTHAYLSAVTLRVLAESNPAYLARLEDGD